MLNIPSTVIDPNYRYRMSKMQLKIQSKGNGIKTNIVNLADVAKDLRTNPEYILKFFGFQKASQTTQKSSKAGDSKKSQKSNTCYIIQGSFTDEELLKTLDKFIDKYILCPKCKLPEMQLYLDNGKIKGKCDSCPFNGDVDNKHRLASLIIKKPPTYKPQAIKNAQLKIQKIKMESKQEETAQNKIQQEQVKVEPVKSEEEQEKMATDLFSADDLQFGSEQIQKLIIYTKKFIEQRKNMDFDIASAEIVSNLKSLKLKKPLYGFVLFNAFFTINITKQLEQNSKMYLQLMKKLVGENAEIETFLNIEYLYLELNKQKDFSKFISTILMKIYQHGLFSEEFVRNWAKNSVPNLQKMFMYNQARNEQFLRMAKDFISVVVDEDGDEDSDNQENDN